MNKLILIIFLPIVTIGQVPFIQATLITKKNETIHGYVKDVPLHEEGQLIPYKVKLKKSINASETFKYKKNEVKELIMADKRYKSIKYKYFNHEKDKYMYTYKLMKEHIIGKLSIYKIRRLYANANGSSGYVIYYYVGKEGEPFQKAPGIGFKKFILKLIDDNEKLHTTLKKTKLKKKELDIIVTKYNESYK